MIITPLLIIFNIIVFILVFLFINTIDKRKWLTILVSIILTPIVYFYAFYPFVNIFSSYHHQKYFKAELWVEKPALRYELIDDIIETDTLIGKTKNEIKTLLGNYEWLGWNASKKAHDETIWNYSLGIKPGAFNSKKECLMLVFKNNKTEAIKTFKEDLKLNAKE
ncbi:hypothetical protein [Ichthyenterobacterium magnum]|uniref:Uncharacterized protein n=1 Tax=Ichthyenterobacterium magnum TaxID=1230530 RepID=A0A420DKK6_9FLAO|nr:hypothetical protein [Ichthyenterobacterium magnum]RKE94784.1 hypothetical protein BXY80_1796 [Ichthyenterobacterium magnum]